MIAQLKKLSIYTVIKERVFHETFCYRSITIRSMFTLMDIEESIRRNSLTVESRTNTRITNIYKGMFSTDQSLLGADFMHKVDSSEE